jgi:hypothetical protein
VARVVKCFPEDGFQPLDRSSNGKHGNTSVLDLDVTQTVESG